MKRMEEIIAQLETWEPIARQLSPSSDTRHLWDQQVWQYAEQFLEQLPHLPAYVGDQEGLPLLDQLPFSEEGTDLPELLQILAQSVDRSGINPASGGHLGYIPGGGLYPTALGDYLAAVFNRYAGIYFGSPGAVKMENNLIRWMTELVGYPPDGSAGNLASGGSIANLIAITSAREAMQIKSGQVPECVIYLTKQVHHCVQKALRIAGLGESILRYIPMRDDYSMDPHYLERQISVDRQQGLHPFLLIASAGTTDTGAIDPLEALADIAEKNQIWLHIDAAYGGFFILVEEMKAHFRGIERSHSIAIDPHKGLFLSYGLGVVLVKDGGPMLRAHQYQANYMQDAQEASTWSPADLSPELTKHFRGLRLWLSLHLLGLHPIRAALREKHWLTLYFYEKIQKLGFEVGPTPVLSVAIYRLPPREGEDHPLNRPLLNHIHQDGRIFISSTTIEGHFWFRLAVLSFRTHRREIDLLLTIFKEGLQKLTQ